MAGALLLLCLYSFLQKTQRSWRCRGSCGLVGLVWEHAKHVHMHPSLQDAASTQTQCKTHYTHSHGFS